MRSIIPLYKLADKPDDSCCGCPLNGETIVPYTSYSGNIIQPKIVMVGESPGHEEIKSKRPFIGMAGQLLRRNVEVAGLPKEHIFIANSARCMIDKNQLTAQEIRDILLHCRSALVSAIHTFRPFLIIALGEIAMNQVLGIKGITRHRGKLFYSEEFDCGCMPLFHPSYVRRGQPTREPIFLRDLKWAKMHTYVKPLPYEPFPFNI